MIKILWEYRPRNYQSHDGKPMDSLPQELIARIASFIRVSIDEPGLAPYATISLRWQLAIEARTFQRIRLTNLEIDKVSPLLIGHRRYCVNEIGYEIILPMYDDEHCAKYETEEEMEQNDFTFTNAISSFFELLESWKGLQLRPELGFRNFKISLSECYSPMDGRHRGRDRYEEDKEMCDLGKRNDLFEHRYEHSIIHLKEHLEIPNLSFVTAFEIGPELTRRIEPSAAVALARKLPNIKSIRWYLNENERHKPNIRRLLRNGFAEALSANPIYYLDSFCLEFTFEDPSNEFFTPESVVNPEDPSIDHLSCALHTLSLSTNLRSIQLFNIVISPDLFWPTSTNTSPTPPQWPNLHTFSVTFQMTSPSGQWYFIRDPSKPPDDDEFVEESIDPDIPWSDASDSSSPSDPLRPDDYHLIREARRAGDYPVRSFRTFPNDALINPLLLAMARAAAHMPKLQVMQLSSTLRDPNGASFEVFYYAAGCVDPDHVNDDKERDRLIWYVNAWRPDEEVLEAWREGKRGVNVRFVEW
ncbi:MAG: hypothetical protein Q9213_005723 [Squamulea squamosa]